MKTLSIADLLPVDAVHEMKKSLVDPSACLLPLPLHPPPLTISAGKTRQVSLVDGPIFATDDVLNDAVRDVIQRQLLDGTKEIEEDAFFVGDLGEVKRQFRRWMQHLPRIQPYYAVKCNPDPLVIQVLAELGVGFDCASKTEIALVMDMGVDPSRIIYANPCKQASHIRYAEEHQVPMMTFDNAEELHKVKRCYPDAQLVLRILTDDSRSVCKLGTKFGAHHTMTASLLKLAHELQLNVIGVSFHVGSGCFDAMAFREAVIAARRVFDEAKQFGFELSLLDVGGGFPGNTNEGLSFETIAQVLGPAVDEYFPSNVRVISEPGRFFVSSAFTLSVHVTARRTVTDQHHEASYMYYVNDGVYGSFNCVLFDHAVVTAKSLKIGDEFLHGVETVDEYQTYKCSIWGPTCDSMDNITKHASLPLMEVGDWMYFENMGAYTMCAASTFNGFKKSRVYYTDTDKAH